jgi:hypothetical protein
MVLGGWVGEGKVMPPAARAARSLDFDCGVVQVMNMHTLRYPDILLCGSWDNMHYNLDASCLLYILDKGRGVAEYWRNYYVPGTLQEI